MNTGYDDLLNGSNSLRGPMVVMQKRGSQFPVQIRVLLTDLIRIESQIEQGCLQPIYMDASDPNRL